MPNTATADRIINAACQELGLPPVSLNASANDAIGYQALGLLNALGDELCRVQDWQFLERTMNFVGDGITSTFPLPDDYGRQVNQTEWSVSQQRPLMGPDSPQVWSWSQYGIVSVGVFFRYRIVDNRYDIFPLPGLGEEFALYYITKNWVQDGLNPLVYKDQVTGPNDIPVFDRRVMIAGLKVKLWAQKGFDTTVLQREFDNMLLAEKGQNQGARVISLTGGNGHLLINWQNISDTGYGL